MKKRMPLIAGNWKMNFTSAEAAALAAAIVKEMGEVKHEVLLAPSFTDLHAVKAALAGTKVFLAAQDICWEDKGAFTGAVSPLQIIDAGCTHSIIGHSERRHVFLETDAMINKKVKTAIKHGIIPILCVGETLTDRETKNTFKVLETQLLGAFSGITAEEAGKVIIAYEPVWAIGTGKTATPEQAQEVHQFIRKQMEKIYNKEFASKVRILYGGSVKAANVDELMAEEDIDGALVGGESMKADKFARVINFQEQK